MKKAECALCKFIGDAKKMKGHENAKDLAELGEIRPKEERPWVFCAPCVAELNRKFGHEPTG